MQSRHRQSEIEWYQSGDLAQARKALCAFILDSNADALARTSVRIKEGFSQDGALRNSEDRFDLNFMHSALYRYTYLIGLALELIKSGKKISDQTKLAIAGLSLDSTYRCLPIRFRADRGRLRALGLETIGDVLGRINELRDDSNLSADSSTKYGSAFQRLERFLQCMGFDEEIKAGQLINRGKS